MVAEKTASNFRGYFILPHPVCVSDWLELICYHWML